MRKLLCGLMFAVSCQTAAEGEDGAQGPAGPPGATGPMGAMGVPGKDGAAGANYAGSSNRSGTRIKATMTMGILYKTMDGAALEQDTPRKYGLYDSKLDMPCEVAQANDGQLHCLPIVPLAAYFFDDKCTRPAYVPDKAPPPACGATPSPPPTPKYFRLRPIQDPCRPFANGDSVYSTSVEVLLPDPLFTRPVGGTECKFVQPVDRDKLALVAYQGILVVSTEFALVGGEAAKTVVLP